MGEKRRHQCQLRESQILRQSGSAGPMVTVRGKEDKLRLGAPCPARLGGSFRAVRTWAACSQGRQDKEEARRCISVAVILE